MSEEKENKQELEQNLENPQDTQEEGETTLDATVGEIHKTDYGIIKPVAIVPEIQKAYVDYAMSVIVSRALPDVRDGLKPVHRRILYAMHAAGVTHKSPYKKSARVVGEVLGKFHPHGDAPVYDAMVRLAQLFSMRYPLIDGQGNFGSIDGDPPAQMRYTEARLTKIAQELLLDIDKETVEFVDNFDASEQEPTVLPALLPNLLLMGADGIAVGMATKIPPHNLTEIGNALISLIEKGSSPLSQEHKNAQKDPETDNPYILIGDFDSSADLDDLLTHIQGPDFPTGAQIYNINAIREVYATGRGKIIVRAKTEIVENKNRYSIIVDELPYQVNKASLIAKIADLVRKKKIEGISDIRDESDRKGLTINIELKRDAVPIKVLNNLFKHTELQTSFPANMVALSSDLHPKIMNLKQILNEYVRHRQLVVVKRSQHELKDAKARAHILEGLLKALDHIDEIIETIKKSPDSEKAKVNLMDKFGFSELQAQAILDMQLRKLAALERQKLQDEYDQLQKLIETLISIITNPVKILSVIKSEVKRLIDDYGDERRTIVHKNAVDVLNEEDLIASEEIIVTLTKTGYIKRMPISTFRTQRRGGVGVSGMTKKEQDEMHIILSANTHDHLLVFSDQGKVYKLRVWDLPDGSRQSKGQAIVNLIETNPNERVQSILAVPESVKDIKDSMFFFTTRKGLVKRTNVDKFTNIKSNGLIAVKLNKGDELVWVNQTNGKEDILLTTYKGMSIRFKETDVRPTGRDTVGVRGISLKKDDFVIAMKSFSLLEVDPKQKKKRPFQHLLIVTEKGLGKRSPLDEYPTQKRGGQGVKAANLTDKSGFLAGAIVVNEKTDHLVATTKEAISIKLPIKNIPILKRPTQGVILMRPRENDRVVAITTIDKEIEK